jgi:WD40 repeat protein
MHAVASAAANGVIRVWDMRSGDCRHTLQHSAMLHAFQFDGDRLVRGRMDFSSFSQVAALHALG